MSGKHDLMLRAFTITASEKETANNLSGGIYSTIGRGRNPIKALSCGLVRDEMGKAGKENRRETMEF